MAWVYPYTVDEAPEREGRHVWRPIVPVEVACDPPVRVDALVDSGCEYIVLSPFIARALQEPMPNEHEGFVLGVGGENRRVRPTHIRLRLLSPNAEEHYEWEAPAVVISEWRPWFSILLGQRGFFDQFTLTFHRHVGALAVEEYGSFDARFGWLLPDGSAMQDWTNS